MRFANQNILIFFRNIVDAKEIDTSVSDLHFPFEMQSVGINDKDGSGIRRIIGKRPAIAISWVLGL